MHPDAPLAELLEGLDAAAPPEVGRKVEVVEVTQRLEFGAQCQSRVTCIV